MRYTDFKEKLDVLRASGGSRRDIASVLVSLNRTKTSEFVGKYVHENVGEELSIPFLASTIFASGLAIESTDIFALASSTV